MIMIVLLTRRAVFTKKFPWLTASLFFACGYFSAPAQAQDDTLDGWELRSSPSDGALSAVTYGDGMFVAVGGPGVILTSPDGASWTSRSSGTDSWLRGVAHGNGRFVTVGDAGMILTSADGVNWSSRTSGTSNWLRAVSYVDDIFVAMGSNGTILTSVDGESWTTRDSGTTRTLRSVAYGDGRFVMVGDASGTPGQEGPIVTSADGASWTTRDSGTTYLLKGVTYFDGGFVAVGLLYVNGVILSSADGVSWTALADAIVALRGVTHGNGSLVAVGNGGTILTSADGVSWTSRASGTSRYLHGITYGNGSFVAVGDGGTIVQSAGTQNHSDYREWAAFHEDRQGVPAGTLSERMTDADGDGMVELMEYALESRGADPFVPDASVLPRAMMSDRALVLDYPRDTAKADISMRAVISSDLAAWHAAGDPGAPAAFSEELVGLEGATEARRASIPVFAGGVFFLTFEVIPHP